MITGKRSEKKLWKKTVSHSIVTTYIHREFKLIDFRKFVSKWSTSHLIYLRKLRKNGLTFLFSKRIMPYFNEIFFLSDMPYFVPFQIHTQFKLIYLGRKYFLIWKWRRKEFREMYYWNSVTQKQWEKNINYSISRNNNKNSACLFML